VSTLPIGESAWQPRRSHDERSHDERSHDERSHEEGAMTFGAADVQPGDVLLFHGKGFISWAIRLFDGTEVNHAAIALGAGQLAEAGGHGLQQRAVPAAMGDGEYMLVHRLQATNDLKPVIAKANTFLTEGHLYAYQQIVLLAFLGLTRRIPLPRLARRLVRSALDHATSAVVDLLPIGASWMICSEYVYRCFDEATNARPDPYTLAIGGVTFGPAAAESDGTLLDWGLDNVRALPAAQVRITPSVAFGPAVAPAVTLAAIEADLAPLVAEYAAHVEAAGAAPSFDPPPLLDITFGAQPPLPPEPTDEEMLASMTKFGEAILGRTSASPGPLLNPTFGSSAVGEAAVAARLQGIKMLSADANFVTPGDLLKSPSAKSVGRIGATP
jgi:hypothetical protein